MDIESQDSPPTQRCIVCETWKPCDAFSPKKKGGYDRRCKACEAKRRREYVAANRAEVKAKRRQQYYADVESSREKNRAYYLANRDRKQQQDRERDRRPANREKRRTRVRDYYARNQEREQALGRERSRRWRKEKPEQKAAQGRRRRARIALNPGSHTEAEWQALKAQYGHRCLRCGRREPEVTLTRDHVIPLGLPGASNGIENIQLLCGACNAWKRRRAIDYRGARA